MIEVVAPRSGKIREIMVAVGETVRHNQELLVIESPELSTLILAPETGVVERLYVTCGEQIKTGQLLAWIGKTH